MSRLGNNPLLNRGPKKETIDLPKEKIVKQYGRMVHMRHELLDQIDFEDVTFINRLSMDDSELNELKESISAIGLLNIIYLQEKEEGKFRIISGLRRSSAIKELYREEKEVKAKDRVVIFDKNTPYSLLDSISIDENLKRKNLTLLEQSYKFNKEAARKDKSIEDIITGYNISKKTYYRIKNAINYPMEIREIIEVLGADKAELLNKVVTKLKTEKATADIVKEYKDFNRDELRDLLKNLNISEKPKKISIKYTAKGFNFSVKKKVPQEVKDYFEKIKEMMEKEDYTFIK
ncbi:ParB/RepB/Spo0J family partition protein [Psychrilyobacter atlanticus]|uniref:ParB/RepB/Spo0J family partition protein n=1 Tax=Psychrilyobacter atlanticus TaxID=271091 RepID=UPI0004012089|nr:ParB N-terminal domain-containing protein [Psychrilyobacter atlanticus]